MVPALLSLSLGERPEKSCFGREIHGAWPSGDRRRGVVGNVQHTSPSGRARSLSIPSCRSAGYSSSGEPSSMPSFAGTATAPVPPYVAPPPLGPQVVVGAGSNSIEGASVSVAPAVRPASWGPAPADRFNESAWYTRQEYFHWNERFDGADFVNERGWQMTLGYQKRLGIERFRGELFGGTMDYDGGVQFFDGSTEPLAGKTGYIGLRGEYDLLIEPDSFPHTTFVLGIGSRFWFRDLQDSFSESGVPVTGYQETWWTIYPYLGLETRRSPSGETEFYSSGRLGSTAFTYEHETWGDAVLHPQFGLTGQLEAGVRGENFFCAAVSEFFTWRQSPVPRGGPCSPIRRCSRSA